VIHASGNLQASKTFSGMYRRGFERVKAVLSKLAYQSQRACLHERLDAACRLQNSTRPRAAKVFGRPVYSSLMADAWYDAFRRSVPARLAASANFVARGHGRALCR
jgi:hypothetical protein